jgi:hypothetical protein
MRPAAAFLLAFAASGAALAHVDDPAAEGASFDVSVTARLDPASHRIDASTTLAVDWSAGPPVVKLRRDLAVREVLLEGDLVKFSIEPDAEGALAVLRVAPEKPPSGPARLTVRYGGTILDPPSVAQFSRERIADQTDGTIQEEGIYLAPECGWYPRVVPEPLATHRVEVRLPAGWDAAVEGTRRVAAQEQGGATVVYESRRPVEGIHLVAGAYKRIGGDHKGIAVSCLFYPDEADLAEGYLTAVRRYLDMYAEWLGPYAYDRFDVVENFFATGYGMPGFTVLGKEVLRLPFIVGTSLGHEVAHGWWGNGVLVDERGGNWSEGLTTYVADYHYRELEGKDAAAEYRREVCRDYTNYVSGAEQDLPLSEFTERSTPASRAVGYGKTMMVFHMLETRLGKARFDAALRRVYRENLGKRASWDTWRQAFSREAEEDLGWYFDQWVARKGAPQIVLEQVELRDSGPGSRDDRWQVSGVLRQTGTPYTLTVPVRLEGGENSVVEAVECTSASTPFVIDLDFPPAALRVDPEQNVFRRLDPLEMPPVLSRVLGDPKALVVVDARPEYQALAKTLTRTGEGEIVPAASVTEAQLTSRNVLVLGPLPKSGPLAALRKDLPREVSIEADGFTVEGKKYRETGASLLAVGRHPSDPARAVAIFYGLSPDGVTAAGRKLVHYGKYSFLAFVDGTNKTKGVAVATGGPLVHTF